MPSVLIIDDDPSMCKMLSVLVKRLDYDVDCVYRLHEGIRKAEDGDYDVILLDVNLPDGNGLSVLPKFREIPSGPEVIIITGAGDVDGARLAVKNGAWDYIHKSDSTQKILLALKRVVQYRDGIRKSKTKPLFLDKCGLVGSSPVMMQCFERLADASASELNVLLTGETGTGKERFARTIHENSERKAGNFVVVDCTSLPETLVESILFGHRKGAFTGAAGDSQGLVGHADGGTLFLDEIGELPHQVQKMFLRVLQERCYRPLGSSCEYNSNFRLISATNRNLDAMVESGDFRSDLLFRIRSFSVELPPLRERGRDIRELALYYMNRFCENYGLGIKGISPEFLEDLNAYAWPGNVRELSNAIERAVFLARNAETLFPIHLPDNIRMNLASASFAKREKSVPKIKHDGASEIPLKDLLENTEKEYLERLIQSTSGDIAKICRISGLSRSRLYDRLKRYNLSRFPQS